MSISKKLCRENLFSMRSNVHCSRDVSTIFELFLIVYQVFSGPYHGQTRRLYRDGEKDIRFILDGEETAPIKWQLGDRMSILVRPRDPSKENWQWTITMYEKI